MDTQTYLRTAELCRQTGLDRETLRYYESQALIPPPRRSLNGYREYPPDTPLRLEFIRQGKAAGFTLNEIANLLNQGSDTDLQSVRDAATRQVARLEQRIGELQNMRTLLLELLQRPPPQGNEQCPLLQLFRNGCK